MEYIYRVYCRCEEQGGGGQGSLKFARVLELIHGEAPGGFPDQEKGKYLVDTHTAACMLK